MMKVKQSQTGHNVKNKKEILESIARKKILSKERTKLIRRLGNIETEIALIDIGFFKSEDFTLIIYKDEIYNFSPTQGRGLMLLYEKKTAGLNGKELVNQLNVKQILIGEVFRRSPWKKIVEKISTGPYKGNYRLKVFSDARV